MIHIRKTLALALSFALIFTAAGCKDGKAVSKNVGGGSGSDDGDITRLEETLGTQFEIDEAADAVTITKYIGTASKVRIPEKINGKSVTAIGERAFADNRLLREIYIPSSVTFIGNGAFSNCPRLSNYFHSGYPYDAGRIIQIDGYLWRILETGIEGKVLLLSEDILSRNKYNDELVSTKWEDCTLREYLNNEFFNALSAETQAVVVSTADIKTAVGQTAANSRHLQNLSDGYTSEDKVFLLSVYEASYYIFGGDLSQYGIGSLPDALPMTQLQRAFELNSSNAYSWWLRQTSETDSYVAPHVYFDDTGVSEITYPGHNVDLFDTGVRPAMWISFELPTDETATTTAAAA